jgi:predicted GIY-YIG superfamily endonuclease
MTWSVYMVRCADDSFYTGIAKDVMARVARHNSGAGARYTSQRTPVFLVYREDGLTHSEALRREHGIKKFRRSEKEALARRCGPGPSGLGSGA